MPKKIKIAPSRHIDKLIKYVSLFRKERGHVVDETGSHIPSTTYRDVDQVIRDFLGEFNRAHAVYPAHEHEVHQIFWSAIRTFRKQMENADPDDIYPENKWIWFDVLKKVAFHLDHDMQSKPSQREMIIDSIREAVEDRMDDVTDLVDMATSTASSVVSAAGSAVGAVADAGQGLWKNIKIVTIVGLSLAGVAIVAPPIIRAVREPRPAQLQEG